MKSLVFAAVLVVAPAAFANETVWEAGWPSELAPRREAQKNVEALSPPSNLGVVIKPSTPAPPSTNLTIDLNILVPGSSRPEGSEAPKGHMSLESEVGNNPQNQDRHTEEKSPRATKKDATADQSPNQRSSGNVNPHGVAEEGRGQLSSINTITGTIIAAIIAAVVAFLIAGFVNGADLSVGEWKLNKFDDIDTKDVTIDYVLMNRGKVPANVRVSHVGYLLEAKDRLPVVFDYSKFPHIRMGHVVGAGEVRPLQIDVSFEEKTKSKHWIKDGTKTLYAFACVPYRDRFCRKSSALSFVEYDWKMDRFYPVDTPGYNGKK